MVNIYYTFLSIYLFIYFTRILRPLYFTLSYVTNMRLFAATSPESSTGEGHKCISMNLESASDSFKTAAAVTVTV